MNKFSWCDPDLQRRGDTAMSQQTSEVLYGWKAIAAYLQRGVRTVQRYEHAHQLPVRHLRGKGRGSAMAFRAELDLWLQRSCPSEVPPTRSEDSMVFIQSQAKQLLLDRTLQIHQEVIGQYDFIRQQNRGEGQCVV